MSIFAKRLALAALAGAGSIALSGCALYGGYPGYGYDDHGYGGGTRYGAGYDPYYDDYRAGYPNIGYGGGWYRGYYYPGYGRYVYDRWGRPYAMDSYNRYYWGGWRDDYRYRYMGQTRVRHDLESASARDEFLRRNARPSGGGAPNMAAPVPGTQPRMADDLLRMERDRRAATRPVTETRPVIERRSEPRSVEDLIQREQERRASPTRATSPERRPVMRDDPSGLGSILRDRREQPR